MGLLNNQNILSEKLKVHIKRLKAQTACNRCYYEAWDRLDSKGQKCTRCIQQMCVLGGASLKMQTFITIRTFAWAGPGALPIHTQTERAAVRKPRTQAAPRSQPSCLSSAGWCVLLWNGRLPLCVVLSPDVGQLQAALPSRHTLPQDFYPLPSYGTSTTGSSVCFTWTVPWTADLMESIGLSSLFPCCTEIPYRTHCTLLPRGLQLAFARVPSLIK